MPVLTEQEIQNAFADVTFYTSALADQVARKNEAQRAYELARDALLTGGEIDGKNAEIRDAQLRTKLAPQLTALSEIDDQIASERRGLQLSSIELDRVKTLIRWLELPPLVSGPADLPPITPS